MPDIFDSKNPVGQSASPASAPTGAQSPVVDSSTFSFQSQTADEGTSAVPTQPFETISLQDTVQKPEPQNENSSPASSSSFLERFKTEEPAAAEPTHTFVTEPSQDLPGAPTVKPPVEDAKKENPAAPGYQMPDIPKSSIFAKFFPLALFLIVIGFAIFLGLKFLPGLGGAKKVEIKWWGLWEDSKIVQPVINSYQKIHPNVTINYVKEDPHEYRARLQSAIARDTGPDIFRFHNTWVPMLSVELSAMPETLKSKIDFTNSFYPVTYFDLVRNNKIYGIPLMYDSLALYYNADTFQTAGVSSPTNWSEVADLAKKLTVYDAAGNIKISGLAIGNTQVDAWSDIMAAMMLQNGADPGVPTDSCATEAFNYYVSFVDGKTRVWDDTMGNSTLAFSNSKAAMYIAPSWQAFELKKMNPKLNFKITSFPQVPGGTRYFATYWVEGVSTKSKNPEVSWDFLNFLSQKENLQQMYASETQSSQERLFGEIYPRMDMASLLKTDQLANPFLSGASQAKSWYLSSRTYDQGINDRIIKYYEDAVNAVNLKQESTEEVLKTVASGVAQVFKDYNLQVPTSNKNCQQTTP